MNALKKWVLESREMARRTPERYLAYWWKEIIVDEVSAYMTRETLEKIEKGCGRYDGTLPTGEYVGKVFLRGDSLWWIGISKVNPMARVQWNSRRIVLVS
jgi:hypothetical protein